MEYYSAIKKEYIWISSNEMGETTAYFTEWSKPERKTPIQYTNVMNQMTIITLDVVTHLEPNIRECEVKWALGSITMNKVSGGGGILTE